MNSSSLVFVLLTITKVCIVNSQTFLLVVDCEQNI